MKSKKTKIVSFRFIIFDFIKLLTVIPGLLWFRPKILYLNKKKKIQATGGALLISNHITFFDPVFLMVAFWYRRFHFITMKSFFDTKFKEFLFSKCFLCLPIDRENFSMESFKTIVSHLKEDELIAIFPEGQINRQENSVTPFKSGMILMALQSGKPIIPVYIKKRKTIFSQLVIAVGEPISIEKSGESKILSMQEIEEYTKRLYDVELNLMELCK